MLPSGIAMVVRNTLRPLFVAVLWGLSLVLSAGCTDTYCQSGPKYGTQCYGSTQVPQGSGPGPVHEIAARPTKSSLRTFTPGAPASAAPPPKKPAPSAPSFDHGLKRLPDPNRGDGGAPKPARPSS